MRQFLAFIKKEYYHIVRDRWTMVILLVMPILMLTLFGFAITTEVRNMNIAICDPSKDVATRAIVDKLKESAYFKVTRFLSSPDEIDGAFKSGDLGLVVVFGARFAEEMQWTGKAQVLLVADDRIRTPLPPSRTTRRASSDHACGAILPMRLPRIR